MSKHSGESNWNWSVNMAVRSMDVVLKGIVISTEKLF